MTYRTYNVYTYGVCMPEVDQILKDNNYPGMKVLEFAFGGDRKNPHLPVSTLF